jgi:hypothetical protein
MVGKGKREELDEDEGEDVSRRMRQTIKEDGRKKGAKL